MSAHIQAYMVVCLEGLSLVTIAVEPLIEEVVEEVPISKHVGEMYQQDESLTDTQKYMHFTLRIYCLQCPEYSTYTCMQAMTHCSILPLSSFSLAHTNWSLPLYSSPRKVVTEIGNKGTLA